MKTDSGSHKKYGAGRVQRPVHSIAYIVRTIVTALFIMSAVPASAESVRNPFQAGKLWPAGKTEILKKLSELERTAMSPAIPETEKGRLKALVMPYGGSGEVGSLNASLISLLKNSGFRKIIFLSPERRLVYNYISVSAHDFWETPLGRIRVHPDATMLRKKFPKNFREVGFSEMTDQTVESVLPFFQAALKSFSILPMITGRCDIDVTADLLSTLLPESGENFETIKENSLPVVLTRFSENVEYKRAIRSDRQTIDAILKLDAKRLVSKQNSACGITPLLILIKLAEKFQWRPYLLGYKNSGEDKKAGQRTTGYAVIAFYGGKSVDNNDTGKGPAVFTEEQGRVLLKIARRTIAKRLGYRTSEVNIPDDPAFRSVRGTFVTLKMNNQLRGCIGNLTSDVSVVDGVERNAVNAAFKDSRFSPLSKDEVEKLEIEVSILTEPVPLEYKDPSELIAKLRPGIDGVIIRKGYAGATFLPQVWDQLPIQVSFLEQLCLKAGLPQNAWQDGDLEVLTYQVQYFDE